MTYIPKPKVSHPLLAKNELGLTVRDYEGVLSTLCAGCGHDSVTAAIIKACWANDVKPHRVAKMSGIGCSSKTPAYFLNASHGFNSVHGRMPSVTTGAHAADGDMFYLGVSGDGDSASIGIGQFMHAIRRGLRMLYIVENNGVYGLTKGQFSATADKGSVSKTGGSNLFQGMDLCQLAIMLGAGFVARSFSGDKDQLVPLIQAGMKHPGFALIDVISPCVTFNNHDESTKSYAYVREHEEEVNAVDLIMPRKEIELSLGAGEEKEVELHDGSFLRVEKIDSTYDPRNKQQALERVENAKEKQKILTGLLFWNPEVNSMHKILNTTASPLRDLKYEELCPGKEFLVKNRLSI